MSQRNQGGKAAGLDRLRAAGARVPDYIIVAPGEDSALAVQNIVSQLGAEATFAVRSSASLEDGATHSFAGLFTTLLRIRVAGLAGAIEEVRASALLPRVTAYLTQQNLRGEQLRMHVVVQRLVDAEVAGVAFGADPVSGLLGVTVINAVYGLGEALVDGTLEADRYVVFPGGQLHSATVAPQTRQLSPKPAATGTEWTDVASERQAKPKLNADQLREVEELVTSLGEAFGAPQDVEFAFADGELFALQTRPITTLSEDLQVYDNANIVESYPGLTLPLTFSFIERMYASVYRQLSGVLGVRPKRVAEYPHVYERMLALLDGRVYYNLRSWYEVLSLLPGYRLNAPAMERMMGVTESLDLPPLPQQSAWRARADVARGAWGLWRSFQKLDKSRRSFKKLFAKVLARNRAVPLGELNDAALIAQYKDFETTLVTRWQAPLVNDFFAMMLFSALRGRVAAGEFKGGENLHNDLLAGAGDIISTEPATQTLRLAAAIADDPSAKQALLAFAQSAPGEEVDAKAREGFWRKLKDTPALAAYVPKIQAYLEAWGARTIGELKLETVTYDQNPAAYIGVLQSYVRQGLRPKDTDGIVATRLRSDAEARVAERLSGPKRWLFRWVLKHTRTLVSERENLRYERTRGFAEVRRMMLEIGRRLALRGDLTSASDVFYLPQSTVLDALSELELSSGLSAQVEQQKATYREYAKSTPPERIIVRGNLEAALLLLRNSQASSATPAAKAGATLSGTGCCPGEVTGVVRVVDDPSELDNLNGGILVTRATDPGWITLFPSASAILVERGSLLSHAAIVSREFGIPCIVGVAGLLAKLRSGDTVTMNGATGQITVLNTAANG